MLRRTPVAPRPTASSTRSRRRSPKPAIPPRRPTCRQLDAFRTTWMPWRASQPRSSNPSSGPRGSSMRTVASRIAPRGGERPTGRMRRTRSCTCARRNVRVIAMTRVDHGDGRAGATVTSSATPASPRSAARTLSRSASIRSDPHASPRAARATPTATRRAPLAQHQRTHDCRQRNRAGHRHRNGGPDREREPDARRTDEERGPVELDDPPHGVTSSRSCSIRVGPMPGTASRSSTEANGPCSVR